MIIWDGKFSGQEGFHSEFAQSVELHCNLSGISWGLTNIYLPCVHEKKLIFLDCLRNITMPNEVYWLIVGDFNFLRSP